MDRDEKDLEIRKMAQDARLDEDVESMVPPTWGRPTNIIMLAILCVLVFGGLYAYFSM
jgi:hypothetical protein